MPSGAIASATTRPVWPVRVWRLVPVWGSQIRTVRSPLAVASQVPSGATARAAHPAGVAGEGVPGGAGVWVPDPYGVVVAGGGQPGAVRGDCQRRTGSVWPVRVWRWCRCAGPRSVRGVVAGGGQPGAVRGDCQRHYPVGVAGEGVSGVPVCGSQIRTVSSWPAEASQVPSGATATPRTRPVWPVRVWRVCRCAGPRSAPCRRCRRRPARCRPGRPPGPSPRRCGR